MKGWRNLIQVGGRSIRTGVAPWWEIFLKKKKRCACIIKQALCSDRNEPQYSQLASCCRSYGLSSLQPCQPKFWKLIFFPLSHIAKFLTVLSFGGKVTRVKAVAGRTSHVSKAHSHGCYIFIFPAEWSPAGAGLSWRAHLPLVPLQRGWEIKVGAI